MRAALATFFTFCLLVSGGAVSPAGAGTGGRDLLSAAGLARAWGKAGPAKELDGRLIFPVASLEGVGFVRRALHLWQPGMDENEHKRLLDALQAEEEDRLKAAKAPRKTFYESILLPSVEHRRWEKTAHGGWFGESARASTADR